MNFVKIDIFKLWIFGWIADFCSSVMHMLEILIRIAHFYTYSSKVVLLMRGFTKFLLTRSNKLFGLGGKELMNPSTVATSAKLFKSNPKKAWNHQNQRRPPLAWKKWKANGRFDGEKEAIKSPYNWVFYLSFAIIQSSRLHLWEDEQQVVTWRERWRKAARERSFATRFSLVRKHCFHL